MHPSLWWIDLEEILREVPEHVQWFIPRVLKVVALEKGKG